MSRHGYNDCIDDPLEYGRWRGIVASTIRGKTGQAFLAELVKALEALPERKLIAHEFIYEGEVCALGAVGLARGMKMDQLDIEDYEITASEFGISCPLAQEIQFENDENGGSTPEDRWRHMYRWAKAQLRDTSAKADE